jgi:hypothetical protein
MQGACLPPNCSANLPWQFLMEPVIQQVFTMNTRSTKYQRISIHLHYDVKTSKHLASLLTTDWQRERQALDYLYLYLIFSCCQIPFYEFLKHTTALHYRYDMQMYCTFVLFVNQHFPGLPASGTHCIRSHDNVYTPYNPYLCRIGRIPCAFCWEQPDLKHGL